MGKFRRKFSKFLVAVLAVSCFVQPTTLYASGIPEIQITESIEDMANIPADVPQLTSPDDLVNEESAIQETSKAWDSLEKDSSSMEESSIEEDANKQEVTTKEEAKEETTSREDSTKETESKEDSIEETVSKEDLVEETAAETESSVVTETVSEEESSSIEESVNIEESVSTEESISQEEPSIGKNQEILQNKVETTQKATEEILFNTGRKNYQVVSREDFFDKELGDACFEEDGSYTIQIPEENPFFPYEVQFTYNGKVKNEWFLTPDDSVEIGGHTFYISAYFDGTVVTQMSLDVAGDIIVVYPKKKEFTDEEGAEELSLLPLKEVELSVDLSSYTPVELTMVSLHSIFTGENALTDMDKVVWAYENTGDFRIVNVDDRINLSYGTYNGGVDCYEMIIKEADQLANNNIRYIVEVEVTAFKNWLIPTVYVQDEEENRIHIRTPETTYMGLGLRISAYNELKDTDKIYIGLDINDTLFSNTSYKELKVYEGRYSFASEVATATEITDKIYNVDMKQKDNGYLITDKKRYWITFVAFDENEHIIGCLPMYLLLQEIGNNISYDRIYQKEKNRKISIVDTTQVTLKENCKYITYTLYKEYTANNIYYQRLSHSIHTDITAAYLGKYSSISEAENAHAEEISSALFSDIGYGTDYSQGVYITIFEGEDGSDRQRISYFCFATQTGTRSRYIGYNDLYEKTEMEKNYIVEEKDYNLENGCQYITYTLYKEYAADRIYYQSLYYSKYNIGSSSDSVKAYLGQYASILEAENANAEEITSSLFEGEGYPADYSQGVYFTIFIGDEAQEIYQYCFKTQTGIIPKYNLSNRTDVTFYGLRDKNGEDIPSYIIPYYEDSYSEFNYLTILVEEDVDLTSLAPVFSIWSEMNLYAQGSSSPEISGESIHDFSKGAVEYTASAENGIAARNYWLQIIKPSSDISNLYINSLEDISANTRIENNIIYSTREVFLDSYHDDSHNIILTNMGTTTLPSLSAELVSDVVELDDYWTLNGNYGLEGFSGVEKTTEHGELKNLAKIRIRAKDRTESGKEVSGTLIIKSGDTILMELKLTGLVGDPSIIKEIPTAVKYVPYATMIQNNNKYSWNQVSYSMIDGSLPLGMELKENGELYGVPLEAGEFPITLKVENSSEEFGSSLAELVLIVNENTNTNVYTASDNGYILEEAIGTEVGAYDYLLREISDQLFVSSGEYAEFIDLWLNGEKLVDGEDYTKESGSTRITIRSQTFEEKAKNGRNTIAAEFRVGGDENKELKRTAQNFRLNLKNSNDNDDDDDDDDSDDNGSSGSSGSGNSGSSGSSGNNNSGSNSGSNTSGNPNTNTTSNNNQSNQTTPATYSDDSWIRDEIGWWCKTPTGSWLSNTWFQLPYKGTTGWYYFNEQGYMATGWLAKDGHWYYLNPISDGTQGMMCIGWKLIDGHWCYFNKEGDLVMDTWYQIPYMETTKWYYFDKQGYMVEGWISQNSQWYYLSSSLDGTQGMMYTDWQFIDGKWYYFNKDGDMAADAWIGDYYVNSDGVWVE